MARIIAAGYGDSVRVSSTKYIEEYSRDYYGYIKRKNTALSLIGVHHLLNWNIRAIASQISSVQSHMNGSHWVKFKLVTDLAYEHDDPNNKNIASLYFSKNFPHVSVDLNSLFMSFNIELDLNHHKYVAIEAVERVFNF
jgi:hypothetical protein